MNLTISNIKYKNDELGAATLVQYVQPAPGQLFNYIPEQNKTYPLSERNSSKSYILPMNNEKVYLNFIAKKRFILDSEIREYIGNDFTYFIPAEIILPDKFTLPEGQFFRCVSDNSLPEPKENYSYYIIEEGLKRLIPNYKTLEVMLFERNQTLLSVRIITEGECSDISEGNPIEDKSQSWTEDYKDQTNFEALKDLQKSVKSGQQMAEGAKAAASEQIAVVKAAEEKAKAEAEAAKAEAEAAKAASEQAIMEAQLAILQAQQKNS